MEEIMMKQVVNLEHKIAEISYKIAKNQIIGKNVVEKALGILVNDGVYAMWLFIEEKASKEVGDNKTNPEKFCYELKCLLKDYISLESFEDYFCSNKGKRLFFIQKLTQDLSKLLFIRQILEKLLIYTRHQYKAIKGRE